MEASTEKIGKYTILKKVNQGGMAEVFKAKDPSNNLCAIKFILPEYSMNQSFIQMLVREATVTSNLKHPNILRLTDTGLDEKTKRYYLSMEYIDGNNLWEIMTQLIKIKKKFPQETAILMMTKILSGLHYAHSYKTYFGENIHLVHLDVNPPNIMISFDGRVKVADFGIARARNLSYKKSEGKLDGLRGKFSYMSPEQAAGLAIDHQTDLYACGIILWEMLTLVKCYQYKDAKEALTKVQKGEIISPRHLNRDIPYKLDKIIMKALQKNKKQRYQTCQEFNYDLLTYLEKTYPRRTTSNIKQLMATIFPNISPMTAGVRQLPLEDDLLDKKAVMEKTSLMKRLFGW